MLEEARVLGGEHRPPDDLGKFRKADVHAHGAVGAERVRHQHGLDPDVALVEGSDVARCVEAASFQKLSGGRQRGREDKKSHFRKGVVGDWKNTFDEPSRLRFEAAAGTLLADLGYAA